MQINYQARYAGLKVLLKDLLDSCEEPNGSHHAVPIHAVSWAEQRLKEIERGSAERFFEDNSHE